jgi:hypothetical protein
MLSIPVIPTGVRPFPLGWSKGVEKPAVRLLRQIACVSGKSIALGVVLGIVLIWMTGIAGAQTTSASENDAQKQLNNLTTSLANGSVASIDILHMPDGTETRASIGPENLEKWWESRITLGKVSEWAGRDELVETMKSTKTDPNPRMPDLRSAVIFNDSHGNRIGALYFGRYFGRYVGQFGGAEGSIGNTPVKFNGGLSTWLKGMIPSSLQ